MRRAEQLWFLALGMSVLVAGTSCGQTTVQRAAKDSKPLAAAESHAKPEELARQMADFLCGLPALSCRIDMTVKYEMQGRIGGSTTDVSVRLERPNKLSLEIKSGQSGIMLLSDGKELVQYVPELGRYTISDAPADFSALDETSSVTLGAAAGLLPTTPEALYQKVMSGVTGSEYLGVEKIGEVACHHLKFLLNDFEWELWVETGEHPVPRKFVPDYSQRLAGEEGAKIEYVVTFSEWNVEPKFSAADFRFEPPDGAVEVDSLFEGMGEEGPHPLLGQAVPVFETTNLDGKAIDLKANLGKNVIMLDFWATWCGPCIMAMPQVDAVAKKYAERGLVFYAVNVGEDADTIRQFLNTNKFDVPVAMDPDSQIFRSFRADGIPLTALIGKDGDVQVVHMGFTDALGEELSAEVEALLAGKDLAKEALAKADEAKKKRATRKSPMANDPSSADVPSGARSERQPAEDSDAAPPPAE